MTTTTETRTTREIVIEEVLPHVREAVWRVLTSGELISRWLMPNDFKPIVGKRFTFRTPPKGNWDGVVHCEVLEVRPLERLAYTWKGGTAGDAVYAPLDSVVTWTLTAVEGGTRLRLVHSGFQSPTNDHAFDAMSGGWAKIVEKLGSIAAELDAGS
jgi:uncharacterized protein YndB with AHSA1/START domain